MKKTRWLYKTLGPICLLLVFAGCTGCGQKTAPHAPSTEETPAPQPPPLTATPNEAEVEKSTDLSVDERQTLTATPNEAEEHHRAAPESTETEIYVPEDIATLKATFDETVITNPLLPARVGDLPENLKLPEKWIGFYIWQLRDPGTRDWYPELEAELDACLPRIAREVINNYNPKRPIAEIWNDFIAAERKAYLSGMQHPDRPISMTASPGGFRMDQVYLYALNFPEIASKLELEWDTEQNAQMWEMWRVARGEEHPDWNLCLLSDGREFRIDVNHIYEFHTRTASGELRVSEISGPLIGGPVKRVVIDLDKTTDEELEKLGGWNYNKSVYTGKPTR